MKTTIDARGRIVIPKDIRQRARLQPGIPIEVRWHDGRIEIEPAPVPVKLVRKGRLVVAVPSADVETLTAETVEETRQEITRGREAEF